MIPRYICYIEQEDYHASINANVSAKEALEAISNVFSWWAANFEGSAKNLNDTFTVRFGKTFVTFTIIKLIPEKEVTWLVTDCNLSWLEDKKEWLDTKIDWKVSVEKNVATINMTHIGLTPHNACYEDCAPGWDKYVKESLSRLLSEGKGTPDAF